jgi:alkylation response protein AidB-like acyl-CoA dehydrogenase
MDLDLTDDQALFVNTTRRYLDDVAGPEVLRQLRHDDAGHRDDYWSRGCELGWTALLVDERDGGGCISGDPVVDLALLAGAFGRHAAPGPLMSTNVAASTLSRVGSDAQRVELLPRLIAGAEVVSWAYAEPRPHDALGTIATTAARTGDHWTLRGRKVAVESGTSAGHLLVTALTDGATSQFLVPTDSPGVTISPMRSVDLTRRFARVELEDVAVDDAMVVGGIGEGDDDVARQLHIAWVMQSAEMVGAMDRAMDITLEWVMDRYTFGRPIGSYQAIKHRLADMKGWLEASHGLADAAARAVGGGDRDADELCSAAKAYIGHHGPELCHECVQFHGGIGMTFEHDLHLYLRRVIVDATTYGTVTDHRLRLTDILATREVA